MSSIPKMAIIALVVIGIGALQFAVPDLINKPVHLDKDKVNIQHQQPLNNLSATQVAEINRGTLYLTSIGQSEGGAVEGSKDQSNSSPSAQTFMSPLLKTDVDIKVAGIVARTRLTQVFKNASENWVNAQYYFPLPENAAVDHLLITIGERKIEGQIKEKSIAKKIYTQAKAAGRKASLVVQQRPNIFSNQIANVAPGETIEISIEYQQKLSSDQQQYSLRFPMKITPRYSPQVDKSNKQALTTFKDFINKEHLSLSLNLKTGFELDNVNSEFHPIQSKQLSDGSLYIQIKESTSSEQISNQDFVLTWQGKLGKEPTVSHFAQNINGEKYGLVMIYPPNALRQKSSSTTKQDKQNRDVIFVLDTSGSMEGDSILQAKQALSFGINKLTAKDTFNLIEFNNQAQNLWSSSRLANQTNKQQALAFISGLRANGGTEMHKAFDLAFSIQNTESRTSSVEENSTDKLQQILFITDGSVSNEASLMQKISDKLGHSRLFTVGIGSAPNSYFMTEAAKIGRGSFTYIGSTQQVKQKMQALLSKIQQPVMTDIELSLNTELKIDSQNIEIYPSIISDLYQGEPIILSYKLPASTITSEQLATLQLNIKASYKNKPWTSAITLNTASNQTGLNVLWARDKISQLTRDRRNIQMLSGNSDERLTELKKHITQTALEHHIVSKFTSLVAVDLTPDALLNHPRYKHRQNQLKRKSLTRGTRHKQTTTIGKLPQTATNAELNIIIGLILLGITLCMYLLTKRKTSSPAF